MNTDMSETAVATVEQGGSVKALVAMPGYRQRFDDVLGREKATAFLGSLTALAAERGLASCEPRSVLAAAFTAATLDLPIQRNLGFAWVVPYKGLGQFQVGWKGYVQLALRTGQYRRMNAFKVCAEAFGGTDEFGEAIILADKLDETKDAVGFAVSWELVNGFRKTVYWTRERCMAHAARFSQAYKSRQKSSPWYTDTDAMMLKTVVSNGLKAWGPMSVQMQAALESDQSVRMDVESEPEFLDATTGGESSDIPPMPTGPESPAAPAAEPEAPPPEPEAPPQSASEPPERKAITIVADTGLTLSTACRELLEAGGMDPLAALNEVRRERAKGLENLKGYHANLQKKSKARR